MRRVTESGPDSDREQRRQPRPSRGPGTFPAGSPGALQGVIGNAAVSRMIARERNQDEAAPASGSGAESKAVREAARAAGRGGGRLPDGLRTSMESAFGTDLGHIRVSVDEPAAARIDARAYTVGDHIVVQNASVLRDVETMAHEIHHTTQHDAPSGLSDPHDRWEREASDVGARVARGQSVHHGAVQGANEADTGARSVAGDAAAVQTLQRSGRARDREDAGSELRQAGSASALLPVVQRAGPGASELGSWAVPFAKRSKELSATAEEIVEEAVRVAIEEGVKAAEEGLPLPEVSVVGHGSGSRLPTRSDQAAATGRERAAAVVAAVRGSLARGTAGLGSPAVSADRFSVVGNAAGREDPVPATREGRRVAHLSVRSPGQTVVGGAGEDAVAPFVHAIWLGPEMSAYARRQKSVGGLSSTARANLEAWQSKVAASGWRLKVWSNGSARDANREFYEELRGKGSVDIESVDKEIFDSDHEKAGELMETAIAKQVFTLASDVARYGILYRHGGVYVDVDVNPADVDLPRDGVRGDKDGIPLLSPVLQDSSHLEQVLGEVNKEREQQGVAKLDKDDAGALQIAVDHQYERGQLGNHFIVSPADSAFLGRLLRELPEPSTLDGPSTTELRRNAAEKTGPNYILKHIQAHTKEKKLWPFGARWAEMFRDRRIVVSKAQREIWDRLGWLTAESDLIGEKGPPEQWDEGSRALP